MEELLRRDYHSDLAGERCFSNNTEFMGRQSQHESFDESFAIYKHFAIGHMDIYKQYLPFIAHLLHHSSTAPTALHLSQNIQICSRDRKDARRSSLLYTTIRSNIHYSFNALHAAVMQAARHLSIFPLFCNDALRLRSP